MMIKTQTFQNIFKVFLSICLILTFSVVATPSKAFAANDVHFDNLASEIHSHTTKHLYLGTITDASSTIESSDFSIAKQAEPAQPTDNRSVKERFDFVVVPDGSTYFVTLEVNAGDYQQDEGANNNWVYEITCSKATIPTGYGVVDLTIKPPLQEATYPFFDKDTFSNTNAMATDVYAKLADASVRYEAPTQIGFKTTYDKVSTVKVGGADTEIDYYKMKGKNFTTKKDESGTVDVPDESSGPYFKNMSENVDLGVVHYNVQTTNTAVANPKETLATEVTSISPGEYSINMIPYVYQYNGVDAQSKKSWTKTAKDATSFTKVDPAGEGYDLTGLNMKRYGKKGTSNRDYSYVGLTFSDSTTTSDYAGTARNLNGNYSAWSQWYNGLKTQLVTWRVNAIDMSA